MGEIILDKKEAKVVRERGKSKHDVDLEIVVIPLNRNLSIKNQLIRIDDKQYVDNFHDKKNDILFGIGKILFSTVLFFLCRNKIPEKHIFLLVFFLGSIFVFGLFQIIKTILVKEKIVVLDRSKGLFAYPDFGINKRIVTRFEDLVLFIVNVGKTAAPYLKAPQTKFTNFTLTAIDVLDDLSFFVWYMDKNRPLPPGDAFDEFRERDFQRRKAEGFPPPLYPSYVSTPEATPEQQAERDKYWEERFTTDENGKILRHFWVRDNSLKVTDTQHN